MGQSKRACGGMTKVRILLAIVLFVCLVATSEGQRRKQGGKQVCKRDCSELNGRRKQDCMQRQKRAKCKNKGKKKNNVGDKPKRDGKPNRDGKPKRDGKPNRDGRTRKGGNKSDGNERLKDPVMMPCEHDDHKCLKVPNKLVKELTMEAVERALDNFNSKKPLLLSRVGIDEKDDPYKENKPNRSGKSNQSINPMSCEKNCETKHKRKPKRIKNCKRKCNDNGKGKGNGNGNRKGKDNGKGKGNGNRDDKGKRKGKGKGNKRGKRDGRGGGGRRIHNGKGRDYKAFVQ